MKKQNRNNIKKFVRAVIKANKMTLFILFHISVLSIKAHCRHIGTAYYIVRCGIKKNSHWVFLHREVKKINIYFFVIQHINLCAGLTECIYAFGTSRLYRSLFKALSKLTNIWKIEVLKLHVVLWSLRDKHYINCFA